MTFEGAIGGEFNPADTAVGLIDDVFTDRPPAPDIEQIGIEMMCGPEAMGPTFSEAYHALEWTNDEGEACNLTRRRIQTSPGEWTLLVVG